MRHSFKCIPLYAQILLFLFILCTFLHLRPCNEVYPTLKYRKAIRILPVARNRSIQENNSLFRKRPEVAHIDCPRLFRGDEEYVREIARDRPTLMHDSQSISSCQTIRNKINPPLNPNTSFPILYARLVYRDYDFLEDQLVGNYASENVYCYIIDRKAPKSFHDRIRKLAECLSNVVVPEFDLEMDSAGHNQNEAHLRCMNATRDRRWEYAILLQNHDMLIKTHREITEILTIYGGTKCESSDIRWAKGSMQVTLSRAAVDFIFTQMNVFPLVKQMNEIGYGADEQLYTSLAVSEQIRLPGGFHPKCLHGETQSITRLNTGHPTYYGVGYLWNQFWRFVTHSPPNGCSSGRLRHSSCINGVEDLPSLAASKKVMANKVLPEFDFAVVSCMSELLFNRTRDGSRIDRAYYENINLVRYHRDRRRPDFNIEKFQCEK